MKPSVLMLAPARPSAMERLARDYDLLRLDEAEDRDAFLDRHGAACRAIVTHGHKTIDDALLDRLPALEIVSCSSAGYDAFDVDALARRDIRLTNASPALAQEVADMAMLLAAAGWRRLVEADAWVRSGDWAGQGEFPLRRGLRGRTLGIVGMGTIGQRIADLAGAFGVNVAYWNRSERQVDAVYHADLVDLARASDILIVIVAGGEGTRHLISAPVIAALGPEGLLVNVARGSVVDEEALITALQDGTLGAAALDVFASEPEADPRFAAMANVTLSPHLGSATVESREAMSALMVDNLDAHFAGRPLLSEVALTR
ncbi:2-hydroxyacid dehydrogenase [Paracoccus liaowanqingii]|uniref:2-hydroxyacid dehydrogenase n=1 Tax=Paracoccus liaowanqingii TaxID=2560053 RepID=A0A4Z1C9K4_9RHOB|nr:2-hydroxyacid dehydrogenase [Paracoccus liaowanqingii]TGN48874.1 2-hydroxyacid dehydrogenase [Paracoccus liaowanqingii]